ncbi:MAG: DUF2231 domain-containing protein, partial [Tardiphaga sp.]
MANPSTRNPVSTANLAGHPVHPILVTLPIGFFVATFLFDLVFWRTGTEAYATAALWSLGFGLIAAVGSDRGADRLPRRCQDSQHHRCQADRKST